MPRGYQAVMPYLRVRDAAAAIKFYKKVFGATERYRLKMAGKIGHAELEIGGCTVMLSDEFPEANAVGPKALKGTTVVLTVYVGNVDQVVAKAVKAGAKIRRAVADQFYGDRTGQIEDPFGHVWSIQSRLEKVNPKDMQKRLNALLKTEASAAVARRSTTGRGAKAVRGKKAAKSPVETAPAKKAATRKAPMRKAATRKTAAKPSVAARASSASRKVGQVGRPRKAAKKRA
ncbi:MAG: VOC family protein [Hyphomicrobiaceae bacterium]